MFALRSRALHISPYSLAVSSSRCVHNHAQPHDQADESKRSQGDNRDRQQKSHFSHPYKRLYPWRTLSEFVDVLEENIVYFDKKLLVINKPWGVGMYKPNPVITEQTNYHLYSEGFGEPKYCITNALDELGDRLNCQNLRIARSLDRYESGALILTNHDDTHRTIKKIASRLRASRTPHLDYLVICKGFPHQKTVNERVAIKLNELDEFGEHKEPEILDQVSKRQIRLKNMKSVNVELSTLAVNRHLATSLLSIKTSTTKWKFVQCYAAQKAAFILGDVRFAKRVRRVLGVPVILSPHNINAYDEFEPLPTRIRSRLGVLKNHSIPLMMHLREIIIPRYGKEGQLVVKCPPPEYFAWTLAQLQLDNDKNIKNDHSKNDQETG